MKLAASPFGGPIISWAPFDIIFKQRLNPFDTGNLNGVDAVLLWGGTDIHPSFYGQKHHPKSQASRFEISQRDFMEWQLIHDAVSKGIPIIGVCRGAQFLCAAAGGSLVQDVAHHNMSHIIKTNDGLSMMAQADHHQMMNPNKTEYELLAWRDVSTIPNLKYEGEHYNEQVDLGELAVDPEVIWFEKINALAIQPHPEWHHNINDPFPQWIIKQIENYLYSEV